MPFDKINPVDRFTALPLTQQSGLEDPLFTAHFDGVQALNQLLGNPTLMEPKAYGWGFNGIDSESSSRICAVLNDPGRVLFQTDRVSAKKVLEDYRSALEEHLTFGGCFKHSQTRAVWEAINSALQDLKAYSNQESPIPERTSVIEDRTEELKKAFPEFKVTEEQEEKLLRLPKSASLKDLVSLGLGALSIVGLCSYAQLCGLDLQADLEAIQRLFAEGNEADPAKLATATVNDCISAQKQSISNITNRVKSVSLQEALVILENIFTKYQTPELTAALRQYVNSKLKEQKQLLKNKCDDPKKVAILEGCGRFLQLLQGRATQEQNELSLMRLFEQEFSKGEIKSGGDRQVSQANIAMLAIIGQLELRVLRLMVLLNGENVIGSEIPGQGGGTWQLALSNFAEAVPRPWEGIAADAKPHLVNVMWSQNRFVESINETIKSLGKGYQNNGKIEGEIEVKIEGEIEEKIDQSSKPSGIRPEQNLSR